jgi:hypothetical protein
MITSDPADTLDGDEVTVDEIYNPVPADAEPVVPASVERFRWATITGQCGDRPRRRYACRPDHACNGALNNPGS